MSALHHILGSGTKWILKRNHKPFLVNQLLLMSNVPPNSRNIPVRIMCIWRDLSSQHHSSVKGVETGSSEAGLVKNASVYSANPLPSNMVYPALPDLNPEEPTVVEVSEDRPSPRKALDEVVVENFSEISSFIDDVGPLPPTLSFNLAAYVNMSESLQQLVKLGVDLSKIEERSRSETEFIQALDFERDMKNHIQFLHDIGVPADELGSFLTKNPRIFQEDLDNLRIRINYLEVKKFSPEEIARIVTRNPLVLSVETKTVDSRLGFLQKTFKLRGDEVRYLITKCPKLVTHHYDKLMERIFTISEQMGFSEQEMKELLLKKPKLYMLGIRSLTGRFNIVHNVMGISHEHILHFPNVLLTREFILLQRHKYLEKCGRAQYDPTQPNYISLEDFVELRDGEFCRKCAKTSLSEFNEFLKTL